MRLTFAETCTALGLDSSTIQIWCHSHLLPYESSADGTYSFPRAYILNLHWWSYGHATKTLASIYQDRHQASGPPDQPFELLTASQVADLLGTTVDAVNSKARSGRLWSTMLHGQRFFDPLRLELRKRQPPSPSLPAAERIRLYSEAKIELLWRRGQLIPTKEVCQILGIRPNTLSRWTHQDQIWHTRRHNQCYYYNSEVCEIQSKMQSLTLGEVMERLKPASLTQIKSFIKSGRLQPLILPSGLKRYQLEGVDKLVQEQDEARLDSLRPREAAWLLGISTTTLRDWSSRGILIKHEGLYDCAAIDRLIAKRWIFIGARSHRKGRPITDPKKPIVTLSETATARRLGVPCATLLTWSRHAKVVLPYCNLSPSDQMKAERAYPQIYVDALVAYAAQQQRSIHKRLVSEFHKTDQAQAILHWL